MNLMKTLVYKNLKLNKKRTIVTIVGIILATALLSALTTLVSSFQYSVIEYQKKQQGNYHCAFSNVPANELDNFKNNRSIESMFEIWGLGYAKLDGCKNEDKPYAYVVKTDKAGFTQAGFELREGRMAENDNEIVIPRHLKTNGRVDYKVGDEITLDIGKRIETEDGSTLTQLTPYMGDEEQLTATEPKTYKIVGIIERPSYGFEDYSACGYTFITYGNDSDAAADTDNAYGMTVYARYTKAGLKNRYAVTAGIMGMDEHLFEMMNDSKMHTDITEQQMDEYFDQLSNAKYGLYANTILMEYECLYPLDNTFKTIIVIAVFVAIIIILTSVYCIKNSFNISITEKIRQYGMLSSIGATKKQIRKSVKTEAAMLGIIGIPAGLLSGLLASFILTKIVNVLMQDWLSLEVVFHTSVVALILAVLLGIVTIYFSATGSARKAAKVTPLEAIRNTNEIKIKSKKLKTPKYISRIWGIGGVVSYKNIKRNNKKYRTTVISIVICSVTFIVISYFMTMAYHLVEMSYTSQKYNISLSINQANDMTGSDLAKLVNDIDGVSDYDAAATYYLNLTNPDMTKDYKKYYETNYSYEDESKIELMLCVAVLDDKSFDAYARKAGISDTDGKGILINQDAFPVYDEKTQKTTNQEMKLFNYKAGDVLACTYDVDASANTDIVNESEASTANTGTTNENADSTSETDDDTGIRSSLGIPLAGVTVERPLGFENGYGDGIVVMNQKSFTSLFKDGVCDYEGTPNLSAYVVAEDADKYQDELEKALEDMQTRQSMDYYVCNLDRNMQQEKSFFTLIGIFAYGLIVVIALIGITNIINTLGTSMELRSREFATLRSIGMTDKQFSKMVRLESLFISAKSLVIGVPVGLIITYIICRVESKMDTVIIYEPPVGAVVMCMVVVILLIYAIMILSMGKIRHKNIIETIKNENM